MIVSMTSIVLKSPWYFFKLSYFGLRITLQLKKQDGFLKIKNTGFGRHHYTLTSWENAEDMKRFVPTGAHLEAMKRTASIAEEVRTLTVERDTLPTWKEAKAMLAEKGKVTRYK